MFKFIAILSGKIIGLVFLLLVGVFYFRLGWLVVYVWACGLLLVILWTKGEWKSAHRKYIALLAVVVGYILASYVNWNTFTNQKSYRVYPMIWTNRGSDNPHKEPEIIFTFVDYPQYYTGEYSNDLSSYLHDLKENPINVTFEVTTDFGCIRGFHIKAIGDLERWKSVWGYAGHNGDLAGPSPRGNRWWCPQGN